MSSAGSSPLGNRPPKRRPKHNKTATASGLSARIATAIENKPAPRSSQDADQKVSGEIQSAPKSPRKQPADAKYAPAKVGVRLSPELVPSTDMKKELKSQRSGLIKQQSQKFSEKKGPVRGMAESLDEATQNSFPPSEAKHVPTIRESGENMYLSDEKVGMMPVDSASVVKNQRKSVKRNRKPKRPVSASRMSTDSVDSKELDAVAAAGKRKEAKHFPREKKPAQSPAPKITTVQTSPDPRVAGFFL